MTWSLPGWAILGELANHLWQSTLVVLAAALLTRAIGQGRSRIRHAVWLVASVKFVIPFALLANIGSRLPVEAPAAIAPAPVNAAVLNAIVQPFALGDFGATASPIATPGATSVLPGLLFVLWACGAVIIAFVRFADWLRVAVAVARSPRLETGRVVASWQRLQCGFTPVPIALLISPSPLEPCIFGVARPILLWPIGLSDGLSDAQLEAVLAHELSHVRRRDNLGSACHVIVETLFWFHPVVWWLGARLLAERERACDQDVVSRGCVPATYAESLLKVGTFCLESRAACLAGVTGSGLVSRIEAIIMHRPQRLGWPHTLLLAAAGVIVVIAPIATGAGRADPRDRHLADAIAPWVTPIQPFVPVAVVDAPRGLTTRPAEPRASATLRSEISSEQAATQSETGRVTGVVTDQTGAPIADATATAISRASGSMRPAVSSADGKYTISYLVPGTYDVRVEHVSFKSVTQRLEVGAGAATTADVRLPIGGVSDVMKVVGHPAEAHAPVTDPLAEARARDQTVKDPAAASNYFDLARLYYLQERFAESEQMVARAVELVDQQAGATPPAASGPALRGGDVKEPRQIRSVPPVYPAAAIAARVAGVVILEAKISPTGSVKEARILQSVPGLDAAALGAIRQMLFTPTLLNGVPVEITLNANVIFELR